MNGVVYLVGAGCGAADLITLRGLEILCRADAVVYDDLIDTRLLEWTRPGAEVVYVGKRSGRHSMPQGEINEVLIRLAGKRRLVCRLKGGDPFVFGRGGEEALALRAAGVFCREVPGVSSAVAIPAAAGIPVTHRGVSRSFHVVTAHTNDTPDGLPEHLEELARLEGTLVFLMGLGQLERLAEGLQRAGMAPDTPVAVIGSETVRGTLGDIARLAQGVRPPAVIVMGGTAGMKLWEEQPAPVTVGLTGTPRFQEKLRAVLADAALNVVSLSQCRVEPVCEAAELVQALSGADWVAFTSPNGVETFFQTLERVRWDLRGLSRLRFAVVGPGTGDRLARFGIYADLIPRVHDTAALGEALAERCPGCHVLLAGAENASDAPERALAAQGISHRRIDLYRLSWGAIQAQSVDYVVFGSASGAEHYFSRGGPAPQRCAVCIGEHTRRRASCYCSHILTAADATPDALRDAILHDLEDSDHE